NHDAANKMTRSLRLPSNVERLSHTRPQTAESKKLRELGVAVHGRSFARPAEYDNLAAEYPRKQTGMLNIGLLHTSLAGAEGHEPYAPCTIDELRMKQYDYWALGHVHKREVKCAEPAIVYPGNIQGRHAREPGAKGCYLVTIAPNEAVQLEFRPLDVFRWAVCELAAAEQDRAEDVCDAFAAEVSNLVAQQAGLPLAVRVILTGRSAAHQQLAADPIGWTNQLRAAALDAAPGRAWVEKVRLQTLPLSTHDAPMPDDGPMGELLRYLAELHEQEPLLAELADELADLRRKLPDELMRGDDALALDQPAALRRIVDELQPFLMSRLKEGANK
ncbi:MAG: DNA repair exonuclease, partial [Patescibacteria group bacterium]|nr:DNA repair exonuclease [Patescibacteria group bacterium]